MSAEIVKSNRNSRIHREFFKKQDKDAFVYKINDSLPNYTFRTQHVTPVSLKPNNNKFIFRYKLPDHGDLGKMYIRHDITNLSNTTTATFSEFLGCNIIESARILQNGKELDRIDSLSLIQKMYEEQAASLYNIFITATSETAISTTAIRTYTPLLFNIGSDINRWLDTKFLNQCELEVTVRAFSDITDDANLATCTHSTQLWCEYAVLDNYEEYAKKQYPLNMAIENTYQEPVSTLSSGNNRIDVKCGQDVIKTFVRFETDNVAKKEIPINSIEVRANNERLWYSQSKMEALLFNHNYAGVDSDISPILDSSLSNIL